MEAALAMAAYGVRAMERLGEGGDEQLRSNLPELLGRAHAQVKLILEELGQAVAEARQRMEEASGETLQALDGLLTAGVGRRERLRASVGQTQQAALRAWVTLTTRGRDWARRFLSATLKLARRKNVPVWLFESRPDNMDPSGIRRILVTSFKEAESLNLPTVCRSGFSPDPIDDIRLVTARRAALDDLIANLQKGRGEALPNVLITGPRGAGRSSAINIVELRLARYKVIRLDPRFHRRGDGILRAVAAELGCADDFTTVLETVRRRRAVILMDDLQQYVLPNREGVAAVKQFVELVVQSTPEARWIVSVERTAMGLFEETTALSLAFGRRFDLFPLSAAELRHCIEARARLAGITLVFAPEGKRRAVEDRARETYYRALAQATRGNLRHVLLTHLRSLKPLGEDRFYVRPDTRTAVPFLARLGSDAMASLGLFMTYGTLSMSDLASLLRVDELAAARFVQPLRDAGILRVGEHDQNLFVPPHLDGPLQRGLEDLGILVPEEAA